MSLLEVRAVCKEFGPVRVLEDVHCDVRPGEVHALIGENGAGKSTLMKILCGYHRATSGTILLRGEPIHLHSVADGERHGIVMIHQELNLADDLTVEENIFLGRELRRGPFLDKEAMIRRAREVLAELETDVDPRQRVRALTVSQKQMVEVAKAVIRDAKLLIMDEPTAVLTPHEVTALFRLIRKLVAEGVSVIYISHKLNEIKEIADRVTVLRDGKWVETKPAAELTPHQMASLMVGRDISTLFPPKEPPAPGAPLLEVKGLTVPGWARDCSFHVQAGEILGFAGLVGAGRTELMEGLFALRPTAGGEVMLEGRPIRINGIGDAIRAGMVYLSEDRNGKALLTNMGVAPNLTLMSLRRYCQPLLDHGREIAALARAIEQFDIKVPSYWARVNTLSGGNRQKLALAKIMEVEPQVIVIDEPTRGIDVGTKEQVYRFIHALASAGKACIMISSDLPEVIGLSHRVAVMREGRITGILAGEAINEEEIMRYATGLKGAA